MPLVCVLAAGAFLAAAPAFAQHEHVSGPKKALTLDGAKKIASAAAAEARLNSEGGVIAVADDGGNLSPSRGRQRWGYLLRSLP
jgi:hypothetical protein